MCRSVLLAFVAVLAVSAVAAASASAEPEWLLNGKPVTESTAVTFSKKPGSFFEIADTKSSGGQITLTCSGVTGKGTVAPKGAGTITEFKLIKCYRTHIGACKTQTQAEQESTEWVRMIHLSWPTKLTTEHEFGAWVEGGMGFEFECTNILGGKTKDTCESEPVPPAGSVFTRLRQQSGEVFQEFRGLLGPTPPFKCSVGGAKAGEFYAAIVLKGPEGKKLSYKET
jgi:hypothetical protein